MFLFRISCIAGEDWWLISKQRYSCTHYLFPKVWYEIHIEYLTIIIFIISHKIFFSRLRIINTMDLFITHLQMYPDIWIKWRKKNRSKLPRDWVWFSIYLSALSMLQKRPKSKFLFHIWIIIFLFFFLRFQTAEN